MTRTPEQEEHARRVKAACELVWNTYPAIHPVRLNRWVDGVDNLYGGMMLPLEKNDDG